MKYALAWSTPEIVDPVQQANAGRRCRWATEAQLLRQIRSLAELMDNRFVIPGTNHRIGLDALIGLVPGIGDLATTAISGYIIYLAHQLGVPRSLLARMMMNVALDMTMGVVPVVGDVLDVAWKANLKNVRLLERHLQKRDRQHSR